MGEFLSTSFGMHFSLQLDIIIAIKLALQNILSLYTCSLVCTSMVCDVSYAAGQECKQRTQHKYKLILNVHNQTCLKGYLAQEISPSLSLVVHLKA